MKKSPFSSWIIYAAFMFLGMGIGMLFDKVVEGIFIGIGLGFLVMLLLQQKGNMRD